jgi:CheY-like chemotaxis protein
MDYGGNGLGLAIVKAYVELLHGSLYLKSEKNKGTKFTISIPISKTEVKTSENVTGEPIHEPHEENVVKTVLIAEDEYGNYRYLYELLHSDTLKILHAINGREDLEICKNNDEISLVLMDIKMPLMDGRSAAKAIREFRPNLPIIAQTAYALESERSNYLKIFDDLIAKPIKRNELKQKMERFIPA